jgi:hypothetical protein
MSHFFSYARVVPAVLRASCLTPRACVRDPFANRFGFFSLDFSFLVTMIPTPYFEYYSAGRNYPANNSYYSHPFLTASVKRGVCV